MKIRSGRSRGVVAPALAAFAFALYGLEAASAQGVSGGLSAVRAQRFDNEVLPFFVPTDFDEFGAALAAGDFDGDGVDDLATGLPGDDGLVGTSCFDCGGVVVRYGVAGRGLETGIATTFLNQQVAGGPDEAVNFEHFGDALAAGDFDGDDVDDLAIGIPANQNAGVAAGAVQIHYGSSGGLPLAGEEIVRPGFVGVPGLNQSGQFFGVALATGDFDDDGYDDLAVGASMGWASAGAPRVGTVTVFHGGEEGLLPFSGYHVHQDAPSIPDVAEEGELFGIALASGDFDDDGYDDLAVGVPKEDTVGAFLVLFGSELGLFFAPNFWLGQSVLQAGETSESGDLFSRALAAGDFDGDGADDLAAGAPGEDLVADGGGGDVEDAGTVALVFGSSSLGIDLARSWFVNEGPGIEATDQFGSSLASADFDRDGYGDLAVGHPSENSASGANAGAVTVFPGVTLGSFDDRHTWIVGQEGIPGSGEHNGRSFGDALAVGDFDADGFPDLAIGTPGEDVGEIENAGMEVVLYGSLFADGFESGTVGRWTFRVP